MGECKCVDERVCTHMCMLACVLCMGMSVNTVLDLKCVGSVQCKWFKKNKKKRRVHVFASVLNSVRRIHASKLSKYRSLTIYTHTYTYNINIFKNLSK